MRVFANSHLRDDDVHFPSIHMMLASVKEQFNFRFSQNLRVQAAYGVLLTKGSGASLKQKKLEDFQGFDSFLADCFLR